MLLWEGGLIKVELCRKGGRTCHNGAIYQFNLDEGELMTIGSDGAVRVSEIVLLHSLLLLLKSITLFEANYYMVRMF